MDLTRMELVDQVVKGKVVNFHSLTVLEHSHFTLVGEAKMEIMRMLVTQKVV